MPEPDFSDLEPDGQKLCVAQIHCEVSDDHETMHVFVDGVETFHGSVFQAMATTQFLQHELQEMGLIVSEAHLFGASHGQPNLNEPPADLLKRLFEQQGN